MRLIRIKRWRVDLERFPARRFRFTKGGWRTPGPWWDLCVPFVGSIVLSKDRTVFGWSDSPSGVKTEEER